jgi:hypothetical protein
VAVDDDTPTPKPTPMPAPTAVPAAAAPAPSVDDVVDRAVERVLAGKAGKGGISKLEWAWRLGTLALTVLLLPAMGWLVQQDRTNQEVIRLRKDHEQLFVDMRALKDVAAGSDDVRQAQADIKALQKTAEDVRVMQQEVQHLQKSLDQLAQLVLAAMPRARVPDNP